MRLSRLRSVPAVEKVLQALGETRLPRPLVVATVRQELAALRREESIPLWESVLARIRQALGGLERSRLRPVINGTGVLIHTNLGRAPLGGAVLGAITEAGRRYTNLELDLAGGGRGGRAAYLERSLAVLCGAQAAMAVNNCAAALVLILRLLTRHKPEVVLSRGELIQIGGGFRIPEILEASGARLREVGTTNRTTLRDYEKALGPNTALVLKVHRSNFFMAGFVESPATSDLASLARRKRVPLVEDLGSGAVLPTESVPGLEHEPTPAEILKQGVDLVCFSGDKLLGGPQAGIIAGRKKWVTALKGEPFYRALRCDKLILAGLQAVTELYLQAGLKGGCQAGLKEGLPLFDLLAAPETALRPRAEAIQQALQGQPVDARVQASQAQLGGGTLPRSSLASLALVLRPHHLTVQELAARLRQGQPPVIGYVAGGRYRIDLRTVFPDQDSVLVQRLEAALRSAA